jgi:2-isopropylmalate synthase
MPYLPIDPKDLGRSYDAVIRVNSQSGKGGIAYLLESNTAWSCRAGCRSSSAPQVQAVMDVQGKELTAGDLWALFEREYGLGDRRRASTTSS